MARQYLRKAEPYDQNPNSDWVMMTGIEFYCFINSPEGKRYHNFVITNRITVVVGCKTFYSVCLVHFVDPPSV